MLKIWAALVFVFVFVFASFAFDRRGNDLRESRLPPGGTYTALNSDMPAFCQAAATLTPANDFEEAILLATDVSLFSPRDP